MWVNSICNQVFPIQDNYREIEWAIILEKKSPLHLNRRIEGQETLSTIFNLKKTNFILCSFEYVTSVFFFRRFQIINCNSMKNKNFKKNELIYHLFRIHNLFVIFIKKINRK